MTRLVCIALSLLCSLAPLARSQTQTGVCGWGNTVFNSVLNDAPVAHVGAGGERSFALLASGELVMCGDNLSGACSLPPAPAGLVYTSVSISADHTLARLSDGSAVARGANNFGQCNVPPPPAGLTYAEISAGTEFSLALLSDGTLAAWGRNNLGQCQVPQPPVGVSFVAISAGQQHSLALRSDGVAVAWGANLYGCCLIPSLPPGVSFVSVRAGSNVSLLLESDGRVVAIGYPNQGLTAVPPLPPGLTYTGVSLGSAHALALRSDGGLVAWGNNAWGQSDVPALPPGLTYVEVGAGFGHSVARRSDNTFIAWGYNQMLECNLPRLPPGVQYVQFAPGTFSAQEWYNDQPVTFLGLRSDGEIDTIGSMPSAPALPAGLRYTQVANCYDHSAAVRSDGAVISWGFGSYYSQAQVPVLPPGLTYVEVGVGYHYDILFCGFGDQSGAGHIAARRSDGSVIVWGHRPWWTSQFPDTVVVPPLPPGLTYVQLATHGGELQLRRSDGVIDGGLGTFALPTGETWVDVSAGGGTIGSYDCSGGDVLAPYCLGLTSTGQVHAWGGVGGGLNNIPSLPPGLTYVGVAAGTTHCLARRSDGSVVAWGDNTHHACDVPALPPGATFTEIGAGTSESVGLYAYGPACGSATGYCSPAHPNSFSASGASLEAQGCPGLSANDLILHVSGLPPASRGLLVYASQQQQIPFGGGWACLSGGMQRVLPVSLASSTGDVSFAVDLTQFPFSGSANPILPSTAWNFQFFYRDPAGAAGASANSTDALHISFAP